VDPYFTALLCLLIEAQRGAVQPQVTLKNRVATPASVGVGGRLPARGARGPVAGLAARLAVRGPAVGAEQQGQADRDRTLLVLLAYRLAGPRLSLRLDILQILSLYSQFFRKL
jgi:hypothetical protein